MTRSTKRLPQHVTAAILALLINMALADTSSAQTDGNSRTSVTVAFGAGLNTAQPGNSRNHHVLPRTIEIKAGGVVNFAVAGFHQISIYLPGTTPESILVPATGVFINDSLNLYYQGIVPAGGPLGTPVTVNPSNASNRVESVSFSEPGTYLVICNVRTHFLDGMYAFVKVSQ
jgi:plastocyanin